MGVRSARPAGESVNVPITIAINRLMRVPLHYFMTCAESA